MAARRTIPISLAAIGAAGLAAGAALVGPATATRAAAQACSPRVTLLASPRARSQEVQAKGMNDRGDVVGFADSRGGAGPIHAILWKGGKAKRAVDLGVLPGYVASEAYGVNNAASSSGCSTTARSARSRSAGRRAA